MLNIFLVDKNLEPHITYEYRLAVWNKHGKGFSEMNSATTKQDVPEGVSPPHWTKVDNREDVIFLTWKEPCQPNGTVFWQTTVSDLAFTQHKVFWEQKHLQ